LKDLGNKAQRVHFNPGSQYLGNITKEMRNQTDFKIQQSSAASTQHSKPDQAAKLRDYGDLTLLPWDCSGPRH